MSWLTANEPQGVHAETWYRSAVPPLAEHPTLTKPKTADLCIVGAGFSGLIAAIAAAEAGMHVVVLEAHRIGWGASGRNGGQVGLGFNWDEDKMSKKLGDTASRRLHDIVDTARRDTIDFMAAHAPHANYQSGLLEAVHDATRLPDLERDTERAIKTYGAKQEIWNAQDCADRCGTTAFAGGMFSHDAGYCNPYGYIHGLAKRALALGVEIYENAIVQHIAARTVRTQHSTVKARFIVQATNGYGAGLMRKTAARVLPINNFMAATEPLGARAPLKQPMAIYDDKFVLSYFWQSDDGRLIFGGGENYGKRFARDIEARVRRNLIGLYPDLSDIKFTHAWGGTLAVTATRLPFVGDLGDGIFSCGGYSGHGIVMSRACATAIVAAMRGEPAELELLSRLPCPPLPGGAEFGGFLAGLGMRWFALRDRIGM